MSDYYCTIQDIKDRLSDTGILFTVDDDDDNTLDSSEEDFIERIQAETRSEVDAALCNWFELPLTGSNTSNEWLRRVHLDLATERLLERKAPQQISPPIKDAAARARQWLEQVRLGDFCIPELTYPTDSFSTELKDRGLIKTVNHFPLNKKHWLKMYGRK